MALCWHTMVWGPIWVWLCWACPKQAQLVHDSWDAGFRCSWTVQRNPITLHAKHHIGVCKSYIDSKIKHVNRVNETRPFDTQMPASAQLPDHLQDLFKISSVHLDTSQREVLAKLILDYQQVYAKSADDLRHTNLVQHTINIVRQAIRRQTLGKCDIEHEEIHKMLKCRVIVR